MSENLKVPNRISFGQGAIDAIKCQLDYIAKTIESLKTFIEEYEKESKISAEPMECGECEVCHGSGCYETGFRNCQACNGTGRYLETNSPITACLKCGAVKL